MGTLADETSNLMLGLVHPNEYVIRLKNKLQGIPPEQVDQLVKEINDRILIPLRERMKDSLGKQEEDGGIEQSNEVIQEKQPDREEVLKEIETPQDTKEELLGLERSMPRDVEQATGGGTKTKEGLAKAGLFAGASKIAEEKLTKKTSSSVGYKGVDPYREATE